MLEQFIKSIVSYFNSIAPMNVYIQKMPNGVVYPCYFLNKIDIKTHVLNTYFYFNTATLYFRIFSQDEVDLKNKVFNLNQSIFDSRRKIPILNADSTATNRFIRFDDIEIIELPVDQNDLYCMELLLTFSTTHNITEQEFSILGSVNLIQQ